MASAKTTTIVLWALSILLALLFLSSGFAKVQNGPTGEGQPSWDAQFVAWGLPSWGRLVVGTLEVLGAVGLLVPVLRPFAASGLTLLMIGATGTHLANQQWGFAAVPVVLGALAATAAWMSRPAWVHERMGSRGDRGDAPTA